MQKSCRKMPGAAFLVALGLLAAPALLAPPALAQQPTQAQQNAIRQSCRADFQAQCSGVSPGGQPALSCLQRNAASVSAPCQQALAAIGGGGQGGATPAAPPSAMATPAAPAPAPRYARPMPVREACRGDFVTYCRGVRPGGGAAIACLRQNAPNLSGNCQQSLSALRGALAR